MRYLSRSNWRTHSRLVVQLALVATALNCAKSPFQPRGVECFNRVIQISEPKSPTWAPDGVRIAFFGVDDSTGAWAPGIYLTDTLRTTRRRLFDAANGFFSTVENLDWSPDGSRIAFVFFFDLWTVDVATGVATLWTNSDRWVNGASWSPDSRYIYFARETDASGPLSGGLYRLDTDDGSMRPVTHDGQPTSAWTSARLSPDGRRFVFMTGLPYDPTLQANPQELFVMNVDGTGYRRLTHLNGKADNPQWSADGSRIFFDFSPCLNVGSPERYTMEADPENGTAGPWRTMLGDPRVFGGYVYDISPDGRRIVYTGLDDTGRIGVLRMKNIDGTRDRQLTSAPQLREGVPARLVAESPDRLDFVLKRRRAFQASSDPRRGKTPDSTPSVRARTPAPTN